MKKTITIVILVFAVLGIGYYLFKISPSTQTGSGSSYNSALSAGDAKQISEPGAFDPNTDRYQGNPQAKNVFVEYADFQCPACAAYSEILKQVPTDFKDTVFVYRYFPLVQIHQNSVEAAMAAEAAGAQGKYWEMHDVLFAKQADWESVSDPLDLFAQYAQQAGVANIDQFKSDVSGKKYLTKIEKDNNEAVGLNLQGTPSFFFNGKALQNGDLATLKAQAEKLYK